MLRFLEARLAGGVERKEEARAARGHSAAARGSACARQRDTCTGEGKGGQWEEEQEETGAEPSSALFIPNAGADGGEDLEKDEEGGGGESSSDCEL